MTWTDEETRAADYRAQVARRHTHAFHRQQEKALAGDQAARRGLSDRWAGFMQWLTDQKGGFADERED